MNGERENKKIEEIRSVNYIFIFIDKYNITKRLNAEHKFFVEKTRSFSICNPNLAYHKNQSQYFSVLINFSFVHRPDVEKHYCQIYYNFFEH